MKSITIVSINGDDNSGGVERVVYYLNKILTDSQFSVKILKRKLKFGIFDKIIYPLLFSFKLLFIKKNIIISNSWQSFLFPADFSIHHGTTAGYMLHAAIKSKKSSILAWMEKISAQKAKKVIAVSRNCKQELIDLYGISNNKIIVLNNFADETLFFPQDSRENNNKTVILFSGRLEERKGLSSLLELAKYIELTDNYILKIASNSSYNAELFNNLKNTIIFSNLDINSMCDFYNSGDVFYFPTKYEGFSMSTLEALACGIPVIGTRFAISEEIQNYNFCILQNSFAPNDILPVISNLKNEFGGKRRFIHDTIIKDFGYNQYKEKLLSFFT